MFLYRFVYLAYLLFQMGYEFLYALYDRMRMAAAGSEFLKPVIFSFPQRYKLGASPCKFSQQTFRQARACHGVICPVVIIESRYEAMSLASAASFLLSCIVAFL